MSDARNWAEIKAEIKAIDKRVETLEKIERPISAYSTWTPTMVGGATAGTTTYAANGQIGNYTRIGALIIASALVSWTGATGTGTMRFSLPFAAVAGTNRDYAASLYTENIIIGAFTPYGLLVQGNSYIELYTPSSGGASSGIAVEAAGLVIYTISYFVA